jgi:hypothetical protein
MKKSIILSIALIVCTGMAFAQNFKSFYKSSYESRNSGSWDQSSMILSFGMGFPNVATGYAGLTGFPPLYVKFEHGLIRDEVGLGGYVSSGFGKVNYNYGLGTEKNNFTAFSFGVLGYYHFNKLIPIEQMDVYAGAGLGFRAVSYSGDDYVYDNDNDATVLVKVGIRYYVKPKFGFYAESGYDGMSSVNLGITLRLK